MKSGLALNGEPATFQPGPISVFILGMILVLFAGTPASPEIYRYKDENGVWHFSNIKSNRRYEVYLRSSAKKQPRYTKNTDWNKYDHIISLASKQFRVNGSLIKAIIRAESGFDHRAISIKGAQGLMQLMPDTADTMNVKDPFDPKENILGGTRYLSLLLKRFKDDKTLAIAAYNAGPNEVESHNGVPPFPETRTYVKKVMSFYRSYNGGRE